MENCNEETLKEKIALYVYRQKKLNTPKRKVTDFIKLLEAERIAELVKENDFGKSRVKANLITGHEFYDENIISLIKELYWDFLLYRNLKAIKKVIERLNKVHSYYGRQV